MSEGVKLFLRSSQKHDNIVKLHDCKTTLHCRNSYGLCLLYNNLCIFNPNRMRIKRRNIDGVWVQSYRNSNFLSIFAHMYCLHPVLIIWGLLRASRQTLLYESWDMSSVLLPRIIFSSQHWTIKCCHLFVGKTSGRAHSVCACSMNHSASILWSCILSNLRTIESIRQKTLKAGGVIG